MQDFATTVGIGGTGLMVKKGIHLPYSRPNGSKTYRASIESLTLKTKGELWVSYDLSYPICSMCSIFTYIWVIIRANVGKYTIHGAHG